MFKSGWRQKGGWIYPGRQNKDASWLRGQRSSSGGCRSTFSTNQDRREGCCTPRWGPRSGWCCLDTPGLNTHRQELQAVLVQVLHRQVSTLPLRKGAFVVRQALDVRPHVVVGRPQSPTHTGHSSVQQKTRSWRTNADEMVGGGPARPLRYRKILKS